VAVWKLQLPLDFTPSRFSKSAAADHTHACPCGRL